MAGLFGLFGGNKNKGPQSKEAFFLSEDDAKSFGDIDFMRKEVVVRRTFAKKKGEVEEMESVKSISSSTSKKVGEAVTPTPSTYSFNTPVAPAAPAPAPATPAAPPAPAAPTASEVPAASEPSAPAAAPAASEPAPASLQDTVVRRTPDTSMDMFRNMAKNIRR